MVLVIIVVYGVVIGGGLNIMFGVDIKFVIVDIRLSIMELKWGLILDMVGF